MLRLVLENGKEARFADIFDCGESLDSLVAIEHWLALLNCPIHHAASLVGEATPELVDKLLIANHDFRISITG